MCSYMLDFPTLNPLPLDYAGIEHFSSVLLLEALELENSMQYLSCPYNCTPLHYCIILATFELHFMLLSLGIATSITTAFFYSLKVPQDLDSVILHYLR